MTIPFNRRRFLKGASALALASGGATSMLFGRRSRANGNGGGAPPLFISVEANQAWDTTLTVDPHAHPAFSLYGNNQIREVNGLRVGPFDTAAGGAGWAVRRILPDGDSQQVEFFTAYGRHLRVVNAVDHRTVSHDIGPRNAFSGALREGFPAIGALVAAAQGPNRPLAFLSTGGFDDTQGIVTLTRAGRPNILRELARPNTTAGQANNPTFHTNDVERLLQQAQATRDERRRARLLAQRAAPRTLAAHRELQDTRAAEGDFLTFANTLDATPTVNDPNPLVASAGLVLAAMRADPGACSAAHLSFGSFDTHSGHDDLADGHRPEMRTLLEGIAFLIEDIEHNPLNAPLRERGVLIYVSSDFGRTAYNGGEDDGGTRGKDHWPVTSALLVGLGRFAAEVGGGTVVGRTSPTINGVAQPGVRAHPFRLNSAGNLLSEASPTASGSGLFSLTATEVNACLRHALRLDEEQAAPGSLKLVERFALPEVEPRITALLAAGRNPLLRDV